MIEHKIPLNDRCPIPTYRPPYDTSTFVNDGPFFELHPGCIPHIKRYERTDAKGNIVESWERDKNGRMVETTQRDKLYAEMEEAQELIDKLNKEKNNG
jgi:hypothetical protein